MSTILDKVIGQFIPELGRWFFPVISAIAGWFSTHAEWARLEREVEHDVIAIRGELFFEQIDWDRSTSKKAFHLPELLRGITKSLFGERQICHVYIRQSQLSPELAARIARLPYLEGFRADTAGMDAASLSPFLQATHLRSLEVMGNRYLTDDAFVGLSRMHHLRILNVSRTGITDRTWSEILALPQLEVLDISRTKIEAKKSLKAKGLPKLREVSAERCPLSDEFGAFVGASPNIQLLFLKNASELTDDAVKQFAIHPTLEAITLSNSKITDKSVDSLVNLPKLKRLDVSNTKVTESAKQRFRDLRKGVELR